MGLGRFLSVVVILLGGLTGCIVKSAVTPADRVKGKAFYYDCCNPGLNKADKEMCKDAAKDEDHVLWDDDRNRFISIWSDCKIGEEPWRKYE